MWKQCENEQELLVALRRELHKIPEIECHLPKTQSFVQSKLEEYQIPYRSSKIDNSIMGEIVGNPNGKILVLRADMDALPITEANEIDYISIHNGYMHACGHDAHTAMLLGALKVLNKNKNHINGIVRFLFQTGEETSQGAKIMIQEGALENADAILGMHIGSIFGKDIPSGTFICAPGCCMASMDKFVVHVKGIGCHGSTPEKGIDPINIASHIVISLQTVIAREFSATRPAVLTIGKIQGGNAFNIIPNEVILEGTIRAINQAERGRLARRIQEISTNVAITFGGTANTEILWGAPPVINNKTFTALVADSCSKIVGENMLIREISAPNMGGEDFAYYAKAIPGAYIFLSSSDASIHTDVPHHNPKFQIDESVLWKGTAAYVSTVESYFQN